LIQSASTVLGLLVFALLPSAKTLVVTSALLGISLGIHDFYYIYALYLICSGRIRTNLRKCAEYAFYLGIGLIIPISMTAFMVDNVRIVMLIVTLLVALVSFVYPASAYSSTIDESDPTLKPEPRRRQGRNNPQQGNPYVNPNMGYAPQSPFGEPQPPVQQAPIPAPQFQPQPQYTQPQPQQAPVAPQQQYAQPQQYTQEPPMQAPQQYAPVQPQYQQQQPQNMQQYQQEPQIPYDQQYYQQAPVPGPQYQPQQPIQPPMQPPMQQPVQQQYYQQAPVPPQQYGQQAYQQQMAPDMYGQNPYPQQPSDPMAFLNDDKPENGGF
jgi:hypothetical protein